jgi:membrane protease YdiL (CAAX protease family)
MASGGPVPNVRHVRVGAKWYLVAFFGPAAALFVVAVAVKGVAPIQGVASNLAGIPTELMLGILVLALFGNLREETSWSGFVTARLHARHGPLKASLIVAPLFGLYHLPLFFIVGGLSASHDRLPITELPLYATFLLIVFSGPMRILLTWIYKSTGHSIPVTAVFHASINATGGAAILATYFAAIDGVLLYAALAVFALIVIVGTRGRLGLARPDRVAGEAPRGARPQVSPSIA